MATRSPRTSRTRRCRRKKRSDNGAPSRSIPPPSMIRLNDGFVGQTIPFLAPCQPCPGMKPKWTKDDTRLMAKMLLFFVGMFSLASFFKGDGLIAGALAGGPVADYNRSPRIRGILDAAAAAKIRRASRALIGR
jgi:hypothetical protein